MITYRHDGLSPFKITVKVDGRVAGRIERHDDGFRYKPKGALNSMCGPTLPTPEAVKADIEGRA